MHDILPYDRGAAVRYAHRWAYDRNPAYYDFSELGGDCTNFASQCLYAGSGVMDHTPTFGWYYISGNQKSPSWSGVPYFYNFLTRKDSRPGPFGTEAGLGELEPGDFIQLSFAGGVFAHDPIVVEIRLPDLHHDRISTMILSWWRSGSRPFPTPFWWPPTARTPTSGR